MDDSFLNTASYLSYFANFFSWMDVGIAVVSIIYMALELQIVFNPEKMNFDIKSQTYVEMGSLAASYELASSVNAFGSLLVVLRTFEYFNLSERIALLSNTIEIAAPDVASFMMMFLFVFFAFVFNAMILFGHTAESYHTAVRASESLFLWLLGDYDYEEMKLATPAFAASFFVVYNIMTVFVLLNVFIGIIGEAFVEAKGDGTYAGTVQDDFNIICGGVANSIKVLFLGEPKKNAGGAPTPSEAEGSPLLSESKEVGGGDGIEIEMQSPKSMGNKGSV